MGSLAQPKVPVVNMGDLKPGTESWVMACNDVRRALEEYGCFVAVCDQRVSQELNREFFHSLKTLFDLPTETKMKNTSDKPFHGYVGQVPLLPLLEGLGIENPASIDGVQSFANLMWPSGNDHFCETVHSYAKLVLELEATVKKMVFESYGVEKYYESHHQSVTYSLRVMKYRRRNMNDTNVGGVSHTDKSFLSILNQNQVNGLEVRTENGEWIDIKYPPLSFLVMAGDALMAWSNDRVKSPYHRVTIKGYEDRYSMGLFTYNKGITEVPEELVDDEHERKFKSFDHFGYLDFYAKNMLLGDQEFRHIETFCGVRDINYISV